MTITRHYDETQIVLQPYRYGTREGQNQNQFMRKIWQAFNFWFNCPETKQKQLVRILDDLLNIGNLIDDIEDGSVLRRGKPTTHLVFGLATTIHSSIYAVMELLEKVFEFDNYKELLTDYYIEYAVQVLGGEGAEIYFINHNICPMYKEYEKVICRKSGAYATFAVRLLEIFGRDKQPQFNRKLQDQIGMFFQIYNDYLNINSSKYSETKIFGEDISEGRFSFPAIHAIRSHPEDKRILNILKQKPGDIETKIYFVSILEEFGSFEYTRKTLQKIKKKILKETEKIYIIENPQLEKVLNQVLGNLESEIYTF